jgi:membrane protein DedA with SNARE-associated domain
MVPSSISVAAVVGIVLGASVLSYLIGRITGKRVERRRWEQLIAGQARKLGHTRDLIRLALEKDDRQQRP